MLRSASPLDLATHATHECYRAVAFGAYSSTSSPPSCGRPLAQAEELREHAITALVVTPVDRTRECRARRGRRQRRVTDSELSPSTRLVQAVDQSADDPDWLHADPPSGSTPSTVADLDRLRRPSSPAV